MRDIVRLQLAQLNRLLADQRLRVEASDGAVELLAREGFDPDFGARPLKRALQRLVSDPLATRVLAGELGEGDTVLLDVEGDSLRFNTVRDPGRVDTGGAEA